MDIIDGILANDFDLVKRLLAEGVEINKGFEDNITPLHYAAQNNRYEMIPMLLAAGAKTDVETADGDTPRKLAALQGNKKIVRLLKMCGIKNGKMDSTTIIN